MAQVQNKYKLITAAATDTGKVYEINEDHTFAYIRPEKKGEALGLFIVADGVGGHQAGEVASQLAVDTVFDSLRYYLEREETSATVPINSQDDSRIPNKILIDLQNKLRMAIQAANTAIHQYSQDNSREAGNLGSTITCALVDGKYAAVANVGDSRTYHLHDGTVSQISEDHSYVATLVQKGIIQLEDVYTHPNRSVITRSLGNGPEVEIDTFGFQLAPNDRILLCSDGVWEMIANETIMHEVFSQEKDLQEIAAEFVKKANSAGGKDNISAVIVELKSINN